MSEKNQTLGDSKAIVTNQDGINDKLLEIVNNIVDESCMKCPLSPVSLERI